MSNRAEPERTGPPYQPVATLAAALMSGIAADRCLGLRAECWWLAGIAALGAWLVAWRRGRFRLAACLLLLAATAVGAARHHLHWSVFPHDDLGRSAGLLQPVCLEAVALNRPSWRPAPAPSPWATLARGDQSRLEVRIVRIRRGARWETASGKASVIIEGHLLNIGAGDRLRLVGQLYRPQPPRNPGEFDLAAHEQAERKLCRILVEHPDAVEHLARGSPLRMQRWIDAARSAGDRRLWRYVGPERAGLASALILGFREQLDRQRIEPFFLTGTMHVLAISGLNVGILAMGFWTIARLTPLRRRSVLILAIGLVGTYAMLTNAEPPIVRAAILVAVMCLARLLGRPLLAFNTLATAAVVILAVNPTELFDVGAQLSFLAVAALALIAPRVALWRRPPDDPLDLLIWQTRPWPQRLLRRVTIRLGQLLATSLAAWLAVLPLVMYRFHIVAPEAIPLNLAIGPLLAAALFAGFGVLAFGDLAPPAARFCGGACDWALAALEGSVATAQNLSGLHFWTPGPASWWVLGCYAGIIAWATLPKLRPPRRWLAALIGAWMAIGLLPPDWGFPPVDPPSQNSGPVPQGVVAASQPASAAGPLSATFIAVGHGVSVLIEFPNGRTLLYDAGGFGPPLSSSRTVAGVLWSRGLRHVDALVISHADADHYNALPELLKMFSFGAVYVSPVMFEEQTPALQGLRQTIRDFDVSLREIAWGNRLSAGEGAVVTVVHPPPWGALGNDNANSIVLEIEAYGRRILLTGDIEGRALDDFLEEESRGYDVVLAPHHGSTHSDPPGFAAWARPRITVISGDASDISPDVQGAYRRAGSAVFHTASDGAVRVTVRRENIHVQTWRGRPKALAFE